MAKKRPSLHRTHLLPNDLTPDIFREVEDLLRPLVNEPRLRYLLDSYRDKFCDVRDKAATSDRRLRAIEKWLATEQRNEKTNHRILVGETSFKGISSGQILCFARSVVLDTIGEAPPFSDLLGSFSGGASTSKRRGDSTPASKFKGKADITMPAMKYLHHFVSSTWLLSCPLSTNIVRGNVMFTVPKNSLIDRVACKEPDLNMYMQKSVGSYFRRCLRRKGIDLNDQSINQRLARKGSVDGSLCTVDLSSASDSMSLSLVASLLPPSWFVFLDDIRSHTTEIDGTIHELSMFSSMGNGFTFELESLIFYSLVRAINFIKGIKGSVSVYGDDIIAPSRSFPLIRDVFGFFGFLVNSKKSFSSGTFRESCGGHYDSGTDVTPFYLRAPVTDLPTLILFLNRVRKHSAAGRICDPRFFPLWKKFSSFVPDSLKGGWDLDSRTQLASPDSPKLVLHKVKGTRAKPSDGAYLEWQNLAASRVTSSVTESTSLNDHTFELERYVYRRADRRAQLSGNGYLPVFPEEITLTPSA